VADFLFGDIDQAFMAGANAVFTGEQMLTTPCSGWDEDKNMLSRWGLRPLRSFEDAEVNAEPSSEATVEPKTSAPVVDAML
jgi:biotin synthase